MIGAGLVRNFVGQVNTIKAAVLAALTGTTGAGMIGEAAGGTVQDALTAHAQQLAQQTDSLGQQASTLAASGGAELVGLVQAGAGSVARTVQDKARETVSVKDFGAVGDGLTDDTAAVQAAIDAAQAAGKRLLIPDGTYLVSRAGLQAVTYGGNNLPYALKITAPLRVDCSGTFSVPMGDAVTTNLFAIVGTRDVVLRDVRAVGVTPMATQQLYSGALAITENCTGIRIENCAAKNMRGGVLFFDSKDCLATGCTAERTDASYATSSYYGLFNATSCVVAQCQSWGGSSDGDFSAFGTGRQNRFTGCNAYNHLRDDATRAVVSTVSQGFCVDSGQKNSSVVECYAFGYYYGFDVKTSCANITVRGCVAEKCKVGFSARRGEGNAPTLHTAFLGCVVKPDNGNGDATLIAGYPTVGIYLQDAYGVTVEGCVIGVAYSDVVAAQSFIGLYGTVSGALTEDTRQAWVIQGNQFIQQDNYVGANRRNAGPCIVIDGIARNVSALHIVDNAFKLQQAAQAVRPVQVNSVRNLVFRGNTFSGISFSAANVEAVLVSSVQRLTFSGNSFTNQPTALKVTGSTGVLVSGNSFGDGVGGNATPVISLDNVSGFIVSGNAVNNIAGGFNDGRLLEAVNIAAVSGIVQGNQLTITNYNSTNFYSVNGAAAFAGAGFRAADNVVNGVVVG